MRKIGDFGETLALKILAEVDPEHVQRGVLPTSHAAPPMPAGAAKPRDQRTTLCDGHDAAFWRQLLINYIDHVGEEEGTDFLEFRSSNEDRWTDEQWLAIQRVRLVRP